MSKINPAVLLGGLLILLGMFILTSDVFAGMVFPWSIIGGASLVVAGLVVCVVACPFAVAMSPGKAPEIVLCEEENPFKVPENDSDTGPGCFLSTFGFLGVFPNCLIFLGGSRLEYTWVMFAGSIVSLIAGITLLYQPTRNRRFRFWVAGIGVLWAIPSVIVWGYLWFRVWVMGQ